MDDSSPYEPVAPNRHPDAFRLASISSGIAGWIFFFFFSPWSPLIRRGIFVLEKVNWRLITTIKGLVKTLHQCFHASIPTVNCPHG